MSNGIDLILSKWKWLCRGASEKALPRNTNMHSTCTDKVYCWQATYPRKTTLKEDLVPVVTPEVLPHPLQAHWNGEKEILCTTCQVLSKAPFTLSNRKFPCMGVGGLEIDLDSFPATHFLFVTEYV